MSAHRFFARLADFWAPTLLMTAATLGACGNAGGINISVQAPTLPLLNPINDQLTEMELHTLDGNLVGSGKLTGPGSFALDSLQTNSTPEDMNFSLLSGQDLEGLSRIFNVVIEKGVTHSYAAAIRKPLIFVGSAAPEEAPKGTPAAGEVLDSTTSRDLAVASATGTSTPLPTGTGATATTADGRFLIAGVAGAAAGLTVIDTGSWATVGSYATAIAPFRIAVGPRNSAVVALFGDANNTNGSVQIFPDVAALTTNPATAQPVTISMTGDWPRDVAISPDGAHIYVLTGGALGQQPCLNGQTTTDTMGNSTPVVATTLAANTIMVVSAQGTVEATWTLDAFVADLTIDSTGRVIVSQSQKDQVAFVTPGTATGAVSPSMLFRVGCPSSVRVNGSQIYMVSGARLATDATSNELAIGDVDGSAPRTITFASPTFNRFIGQSLDPSGLNAIVPLQVLPSSVYAYDMAVSPDGDQVLFAVRGSYQYPQNSTFIGYAYDANGDPTLFCDLSLNGVSYSLYTVDTVAGTVRNDLRSDLVVGGASEDSNCSLTCGYDKNFHQTDPDAFGGVCAVDPDLTMTEKAIGLSALFGGF